MFNFCLCVNTEHFLVWWYWEGKQEQLIKQTCNMCVMKELRLMIINQNKKNNFGCSNRENSPLQHGSALHSLFTPHVA